MAIYIQTTAQAELHVGAPLVVQGAAPTGTFAAVFEDDGETGYFYAVDPADPKQPIQDALHIYNVQDVADRSTPSEVKIGWSSDSHAVLLAINGNVHAVFNFARRDGCCRSGFPSPDGRGWASEGHEWRDEVLDVFSQSTRT